jgi:hypothetical protein
MSRYGDDYDGDNYPNANALFWANADRALKGKRGRKVLADLREALLALPEPRLIDSALCTVSPEKRAEEFPEAWMRRSWLADQQDGPGEGVCAIGALLWHRKVKAGMDPAEAFDSLPTLPDTDYGLEDTADLAVTEAGLAYSLAWNLAYRNDETFEGMTPEERHAAFLAWIDRELAEVAAA